MDTSLQETTFMDHTVNTSEHDSGKTVLCIEVMSSDPPSLERRVASDEEYVVNNNLGRISVTRSDVGKEELQMYAEHLCPNALEEQQIVAPKILLHVSRSMQNSDHTSTDGEKSGDGESDAYDMDTRIVEVCDEAMDIDAQDFEDEEMSEDILAARLSFIDGLRREVTTQGYTAREETEVESNAEDVSCGCMLDF